jgi:hypothetical protein
VNAVRERRARALAVELDSDLIRARDIVRRHDLRCGYFIERELDEAINAAHLLIVSFARLTAFNDRLALDETAGRVSHLLSLLSLIRNHALQINRAQSEVDPLVVALDDASVRVVALAQRMAAPDQQPEETSRVRISPLAGRAADAAARLLPCVDRLRYAEEYRAELYELALDSRRAQWTYAVRLLAYALPLRHELRRDAREVVQGQ